MIESEGHGATIEKGDRVTVHATGIVKETGKKFWSTKGKLQYRKENAHINQPFFLVVGQGAVQCTDTAIGSLPGMVREPFEPAPFGG